MKKKMRIGKYLTSGLLIAGAVLTLAGCGNKKAETDDSVTKIGILQYVEHGSLDAAREGFIEELAKLGYKEGDNLKIDLQNAQGDQANLKSMSERLVSDGNDLILAIATPAAQAVSKETTEIPILITAVTDAVDAKLVKSDEEPGANVTGTVDMGPIEDQIELLLSLTPDAKKVGILYSSNEDNSTIQAKIAKEELEKRGIEVEELTVSSSNDVQQTTETMASKVDAIYIPTDNIFASAMKTVGKVAEAKQIPVVTGSMEMAEDGGLATVGIDYKKLGAQTARMAVKILEGEEKPATMPIETLDDLTLVVNEDMAKALGIDPASIKLPE